MLTDIQSDGYNCAEFSRGNIGSVTDSIAQGYNELRMFLVVPATTDVKSGIQYGQQGTEKTGTYVGGGGGGETSHIF